jgi:hypothetical protein
MDTDKHRLKKGLTRIARIIANEMQFVIIREIRVKTPCLHLCPSVFICGKTFSSAQAARALKL